MTESKELESISERRITEALEEARARAIRAKNERVELDRVIAAAQEEERLLEGLLALRRGGTAGVEWNLPSSGHEAKQPVVQAVLEELTAAERPLHISELMRLLTNRGTPIPGSGTQANLIAHLRRDERIVRPSRGMYGLAAWGLESMQPPRRKRRRKQRVRTTAPQRRNKS